MCLSSEGPLSLEMEKVLSAMPGAEGAPKSQKVLEINADHPIFCLLYTSLCFARAYGIIKLLQTHILCGGGGTRIMQTENIIEMLHITKEFPGIIANDDITLHLRRG